MTLDLFAVWYPGLCSKCHLIHGSFSGNPADPQKAHIQSKPTVALQKITSLMKRHNHYALRIKKNGWKINFLLIRGYIPIIANWQAIELVQQTGQFGGKHCLYLLDSSLLTQKKNKISAVNYAYIFFALQYIPIEWLSTEKICPKHLKHIYLRLDTLTELIVKGKCVWQTKPPQPNHTRLSYTSQKSDHVRMRFYLFHCFKFFHQISLVRFSSIS